MAEELEDLVPENDREFLAAKRYDFSASRVGEDVHLVIQKFPFPAAYTPRESELLIILPSGYPNAKLDMFYANPEVRLLDGAEPLNCGGRPVYGTVTWQQWSRHFATEWRQGVDDVRSFIASVKHELAKGI